MEFSNPSDYAKYKDRIQNILAYLDYVGQNPSDNSISYIKEFIIDIGDVETVTPPYFYYLFIT